MTEKPNVSNESWDGLVETYLKAEHSKTFPFKVFCAFVKVGLNRDDKPQMICDIHFDNKKFKWDANKTNMKKLVNLGIKTPKDLQNKSITFDKIRVQNPKTNQSVDSLEVVKVE